MTNLIVGNIQVERIIEMVLPFETISTFFPAARLEQIEACRTTFEPWALCPKTGKIILVIQSYLVRTQKHTILIDTCVGCDKTIPYYMDWNKRQDRGWLNRLAKSGVSITDADFVLCTHLHCDHAGWNTQLVNGRWVPTFPNAKNIVALRLGAGQQQEGLVFVKDKLDLKSYQWGSPELKDPPAQATLF